MGRSYQDIDVRLEGVENALMFLMKMVKIRQMVDSPLSLEGPRVEEVDLYTIYRRALAGGIVTINQVGAEEDGNRTDAVAAVSE